MSENVRGQEPRSTDQDTPQSEKGVRENVTQPPRHNESTSTGLDEKSSGMARRDRGTGLSTKDGVTGSDLDGQVTD